MAKYLIEVYECYGSSCEIEKKDEVFVIDSMADLTEALEDVNYEWLADLGDPEYEKFANGDSTTALIEYFTGEYDDPMGYKLVRYSYEEMLKQIQKTYKEEQEKLNKLFNI